MLLDFGQTLVDSSTGFRRAEKEAQLEIYRDLALMAHDEFLESYRDVRSRFQQARSFSRSGMWREVYALYGREAAVGALQKMELEYWKTVNQGTTAFEETERVLSQLKTRYRLAVISNTQGQSYQERHRIAEFPELGEHFEAVIIAGEGGIPPKPDPRPFHVCLDRVGLQTDEVIFVGDDWSVDIEGALNVGIRPVWLKHRSVKRNWPDAKVAVPVIEGLEELLEIDRVLADVDTVRS